MARFEIYLKSARVTTDTLKTYLPVAKKFLSSVVGLDEDAFRTYMANSYELKNNTALRNYYALRALYKSQNIQINVPAPPVEDHPNQPTLEPTAIQRLIVATKAGGNSTERGLVALATTYGLRRKEMRQLTRGDLNYDGRTITIRAVKHGRERAHIIPEPILDFVINYDFKLRSQTEYATIFWAVVRRANLALAPGFGWHSIRRALFTGFTTNELDYFLRHEFMRWQIRGMNLDQIYSQNPPAQIDKKAFEKHPFLPFWI